MPGVHSAMFASFSLKISVIILIFYESFTSRIVDQAHIRLAD
ncbi:hypothetical protein [Desulfonatronovibrio magnus]|nr:hypothetical protein [Desulfonatronovibrio magnus]